MEWSEVTYWSLDIKTNKNPNANKLSWAINSPVSSETLEDIWKHSPDTWWSDRRWLVESPAREAGRRWPTSRASHLIFIWLLRIFYIIYYLLCIIYYSASRASHLIVMVLLKIFCSFWWNSFFFSWHLIFPKKYLKHLKIPNKIWLLAPGQNHPPTWNGRWRGSAWH